MTAVPSPILPGEILAKKYRIERMVGQGGMGVVVAARHLELEQTVAIKFLVGDAPKNALERFMREAKAAALVKSEHVCRVHDFGRLDSGEPYIVMEYLEGCDLAEKVANEGAQPIADAVGWIIEACDALSSAHAQGIVHRDLKPANLFLQESSDGAAAIKVLDFGISKLARSGDLTSTAVMMGSPFYMSPEQLESSRDVDQRSDIWSLGVVLYELLTGAPPFNADSLVQLAVQAREKDPKPPTETRPEIPAELEAIISKCMAKRAADRYEGVHPLVVDLAPFAPPEVAAIVSKLSKRGRRSDPEVALQKTVAAAPASTPKIATPTRREGRAPSSDAVAGGRTFAPVQKGREPPPSRWRFVAVGVALAAAVGVGAVVRSRSAPMPSVTSASPAATRDEPPEKPPGEPRAADVASAPPPVPAQPSASVAPRPHLPGHQHPPAKPSASAPVAPIPPAPAPTASAKSKHELDREYTP